MGGALREALAGVRAGRGRIGLRALGTALAAAMLAIAATVAYGLDTGFARSAREADLPDVIARFDALPESEVARRIRALPDVAAFSLRRQITGVGLRAGSDSVGDAALEAVGAGPRGYAIVAGRDLSDTSAASGGVADGGASGGGADGGASGVGAGVGASGGGAGVGESGVGAGDERASGGVVVEEGLARAWGLAPGGTIEVAGLGAQRILGLARSPDNVAYPLASPRVYASRGLLAARFGRVADPAVNLADIWLRDPAELDAVLVQARTTSYGLHDLSILTRSGLRVLIDEAAGIVIALLAALSLVALLTAAVMLAASARADVQRRLPAIGIRRAIGATPAHVAAVCALETLVVVVPAAAIGVLAGALVGAGPSDRLLALLNEAPPGAALALPLAGCFVIAVAIPTALAAWPAWRVAGGAPVALLRGAELRRRGGSGRGPTRSRPDARPRPARWRDDARSKRARSRTGRVPGRSRWNAGGMIALGARLAIARRVRLSATIVSLAVCSGFVLLMLALASALAALESDPAALGRRYQLSASLPAAAAGRVRSLAGVQAVAPRYEVSALDSFSLGEVIDVIAYPGDQTTFEDPPLVSGATARGPDQAQVGLGLAQVLGLSPGSTLALALPSGRELRVRVAGVVSSLQHDGRVAYVPAGALLAADPGAGEQLVLRLDPGASAATVTQRLGELGAGVTPAAGVAGHGGALVAALQALLRAVAAVDVLVCAYTLAQALALTASERRSALALLRACGASAHSLRALLAGAALAVLLPAAAAGIALERLLLGPAIARIAAGYAAFSLGADTSEIALLVAGLALLAGAAVGWVAARAMAAPVARGLA